MIRLERLSRLMRSASQSRGLNAAQWEALRYLSRANSFSNSPGALTRYVGATKGTTSQTVLALIKKGLLSKNTRNDDARSVALTLTELGHKTLSDDPPLSLEKAIGNLGDKTAKKFSKGLAEILTHEVTRQNEPSFGSCKTCKHAAKQNQCGLFKVEISGADAAKLCVHHQGKS